MIEPDKLVDPEIIIEDWPQLDFPISHHDADFILLQESEPEGLTGRGLDISQIRLRNPKWDSFLKETILPAILPKLGLESVKLEPPVLRIQAPGTQRYSLSSDKSKDPIVKGGISVFMPWIQKDVHVECSCPRLSQEEEMLVHHTDSSVSILA